MINLQLKPQRGAATLIIAAVILTLITMIIIFAANFGIVQNKIAANQSRNADAFESAQAGLDFGIQYLRENQATILGSTTNGYINPYSDSNINNVPMTNGSTFTVTYSNPVQNNYDLIRVTSVGTSGDGTATSTVTELFQKGEIVTNPGTNSVVSKGDFNMSGNATITNTESDQTITSGGSASLSGSSQTVTSTGGSTPGSIGPDISDNDSTISSQSEGEFFETFFGTSSYDTVKSQMAIHYDNSTDSNHSSDLNGLTNTAIWIDQASGTSTTLNGNTTIGSADEPVILVINGKLNFSGNVTIYGFVFAVNAIGISGLSGNIAIYGAFISSSDVNILGSAEITYDSAVLTKLSEQGLTTYFGRVPGSWRDF